MPHGKPSEVVEAQAKAKADVEAQRKVNAEAVKGMQSSGLLAEKKGQPQPVANNQPAAAVVKQEQPKARPFGRTCG
jgi:hypothetical protein